MNNVKIWEEIINIPTYEIGAADKNPMFLEKRVYQGSTGKVYPYPTVETISKEKKDKKYKAVFLENKYLKIMVLPELGGRIQRAYDKTNDYDFVYYNEVIKPALVGLVGPWISGGIEFNWPQHHRPTTYLPTDYQVKDNQDGSKTLLVNDVDQINGTKGITGFTLYEDKAYIEISGQLYNRTPLPQTFLWWANPAVAVNEYTQSIFPPDVFSVYDHGKRAVSRFPIATGEYYKHDYSEGVDISRYKNIPVPTSYMAEKSDFDFVGGYDYQKNAGIIHVADHHVSPGKKQWTWGNGEFGLAWDSILTDDNGPYIELMTGVYTDNQPDFTWLKPFEEKSFKQYFMPYKKVGQVKNATTKAVLGLEVINNKASIVIYGTALYKDVQIVLTYNGENIHQENTTISPTEVFEKTFDFYIEDEHQLRVCVIHNNDILVEYQAKKQGIPKLAEPAVAARFPEEIRYNEELYLTGQHIEQYRHATYLPDPYYLEGLKRDEGDVRINIAYGQLLLRRGLFTSSEKHFKKALERLCKLNPNPYDSEAYYSLGLSLFYQKKYDDAYKSFYKATWTNEQQEMSYYYLAAISAINKDYKLSLEHIDKGLTKNTRNIKARALRVIILRNLGLTCQAIDYAKENLNVDTFDFISRIELNKLTNQSNEDFISLARNFNNTFLQIARDYQEVGCYQESYEILSLYKGKDPLIEYYKGYANTLEGKDATNEYQSAQSASPDYCFPNKLEDINVLNDAIEKNGGSFASYYLGTLYYDKLQFNTSITLWENSLKQNKNFPTVYRNLAIAYYNKLKDKIKAKEYLSKAFELNKNDARVFLEYDQLLKKLGTPFDVRYQLYQDNISIINLRDDLYIEYITLLNQCKQYQEAYNAIMEFEFRPWEGAEGKISTQYKIALWHLALNSIENKEYEKAVKELELSLITPKNLGEGKLEGTKNNHLYYTLGLAYEGLNDITNAKRVYELATLGVQEPAGMLYYYDQPADMILYQGLAYLKLENQLEAKHRFNKLVDYGERHIRDDVKDDYFAVSLPDFLIFEDDLNSKNVVHCYYLMALGYLGLNDKTNAIKYFKEALDRDMNHQNARIYLAMIK